MKRLINLRYTHILTACSLIWVAVAYSMISDTTLESFPSDIAEVKKLPDFASITDVKTKKAEFFNFLLPIVVAENNIILQTRAFVLAQLERSQSGTQTPDYKKLLKLAKQYKISDPKKEPALIRKLLKRVDTVPPSLVLAQAAIESGWGSSRFAKKGNNLFGQWCFKKGCGMIPSSRASHLSHEVAKFDSVNKAVRAYLLNLNSFNAYHEFREIRAKAKKQGQPVSSHILLAGLISYSEQGQVYLNKVEKMIRRNKLVQYD